MREKAISIVLVVSILLSMLAGCSNANPVVDPTGTSENAATNETGASATTSTSDPTTALSETVATEESTEAPTEATTVPTEAPTEPIETTQPETTPPTTQPPETTPPTTEAVEEEDDSDLTTTQRNSINMLNYITVLTQEINASKGSRIYLESVQSSLLNNIYPNAVDSKTQSQINNLWKTIEEYRMIAVKRDRLEYIYEQNIAMILQLNSTARRL